ncbi:MAG TPA: response regulator transcription factor [Kribbella sp.]
MIVDDHDLLRDAIHIALKDVHDIDLVGVAKDGLEALETAARLSPDAVLMDLAMPHLDGIEATRRLLQLQPQIRVVAWTSAAGGMQADAALTAGAVSVIYKDAELDSIIQAIRAAIESGR